MTQCVLHLFSPPQPHPKKSTQMHVALFPFLALLALLRTWNYYYLGGLSLDLLGIFYFCFLSMCALLLSHNVDTVGIIAKPKTFSDFL